MIIPSSVRFVNYQVTFGVATCSLLCSDADDGDSENNDDENKDDTDDHDDVDGGPGSSSCGGRMKIECEIGNPMRKGQKINVKFRMDGSDIPSHTSKGQFYYYNHLFLELV